MQLHRHFRETERFDWVFKLDFTLVNLVAHPFQRFTDLFARDRSEDTTALT